jgi:hypothetical protein
MEDIERNFTPKPTKLVICYSQMQDVYLTAKPKIEAQGCEVEFMHSNGDISIEDFCSTEYTVPKPTDHTLILVDDLTIPSAKSENVAKIAMEGRHRCM